LARRIRHEGLARTTWEEAAAMYRDQHRHQPAERVQRQLDALERTESG
jgi:hypothetical protein